MLSRMASAIAGGQLSSALASGREAPRVHMIIALGVALSHHPNTLRHTSLASGQRERGEPRNAARRLQTPGELTYDGCQWSRSLLYVVSNHRYH
jgi:hypothetical protein